MPTLADCKLGAHQKLAHFIQVVRFTLKWVRLIVSVARVQCDEYSVAFVVNKYKF